MIQVHADVEEEMAADPLLGEVGWSWLTDALDLHAPGYAAPSGTVTRVITEGYGAKADEPPSTGFELRASWCPADDGTRRTRSAAPSLAWCELLAAAAGLPAAGTLAIGGRGARARAGGPGAGLAGPVRFRRAAAPVTAASEESEEQTPDAAAVGGRRRRADGAVDAGLATAAD